MVSLKLNSVLFWPVFVKLASVYRKFCILSKGLSFAYYVNIEASQLFSLPSIVYMITNSHTVLSLFCKYFFMKLVIHCIVYCK